MSESAFFQVSVPSESRAKLERLARGSKRSLGNVVAVLIAMADESAPIWNIASSQRAGSANEPESGSEDH